MKKNTVFHSITSEKLNVIQEILGDDTPEVYKKALFTRNIYGDTPLTFIKADELKAFAQGLGDDAKKVLNESLRIKNECNATFLTHSDSKTIKATREILGDEDTKKLLIELLPIQNKGGHTPFFNADKDTIDIFANCLGNDAEQIIGKALRIRNNNGYLPISKKYANLEKIIALSNISPVSMHSAMLEPVSPEDRWYITNAQEWQSEIFN